MNAKYQGEDYRFPEEVAATTDDSFEIEVDDDTPPEDRNRTPMPKSLVEELEKDELDKYDDAVKEKLKQMRKVWHDERREKETVQREYQETINIARKLMQENEKYKSVLSTGEKQYAEMLKETAEANLEKARRVAKDAYDSGDSEGFVKATEDLNSAQMKLMEAQQFRVPALQNENFEQEFPQEEVNRVAVDPKLDAWQKRNAWFGNNEKMTAYALATHAEIKKSGMVVGSDDYYRALDKDVRQRFPEAFEQEEAAGETETGRSKPATVVAPAVRSTSSKKVRLTQTQMNVIRKFGITPEQYVKEYVKVNQNG
jgi:hypothetical protein